jgi:hypothetical protein
MCWNILYMPRKKIVDGWFRAAKVQGPVAAYVKAREDPQRDAEVTTSAAVPPDCGHGQTEDEEEK